MADVNLCPFFLLLQATSATHVLCLHTHPRMHIHTDKHTLMFSLLCLSAVHRGPVVRLLHQSSVKDLHEECHHSDTFSLSSSLIGLIDGSFERVSTITLSCFRTHVVKTRYRLQYDWFFLWFNQSLLSILSSFIVVPINWLTGFCPWLYCQTPNIVLFDALLLQSSIQTDMPFLVEQKMFIICDSWLL